MEYEKTYLEIFKEHYPNVVLKGFYGNYCPAGFFKYGMDMHHPDCSAECDKCWSCTADSEWCESGDYEIPEEWKGISAPAQTEAAVFDMQTAEQTADVFNYAVLSAEMGDYLKRKEEQLKNEYMNFTANCGRIFAEAQEKLAKNGFGDDNGLFRKWIASMGFSKTTVYRMIDIYKFRLSQIGTDEGKTFFDALPKTLQADISAPSAPPELVDKVMSGDITTHKEYIKLKKQLEEAEELNAALSAEKEQFHRASKANLEKLNEERERNADLERQIKELESRPVDIQIQQPDEAEISVQAREMAQGLIRSAEAAADMRVREFQQELEKKDKELNELSEKLREAQASVLDAAFESNSESGAEQIREFYEMLHSRALSALRDCFDFIGMDIPSESAKTIRSRLRTFGEVVELYINELEER